MPDAFVERRREGTESAVERLAGVRVGERSGARWVGEEGEVREPESGHLFAPGVSSRIPAGAKEEPNVRWATT